MRKAKLSLLLLLLTGTMVALQACLLTPSVLPGNEAGVEPERSPLARNEPISADDQADEYSVDENGLTRFGFGEYTEPKGWAIFAEQSEHEGYGLDEKRYYLQEGSGARAGAPTNISVEIGSNRYAPEENAAFRQGIVASLSAQADDSLQGLTGDGTYSANGYYLYIFTLEYDDNITTQYYVVGDRKYFLVIATDWKDPAVTDVNVAARSIVDSFVWDDLAAEPR
jgi:hypothetical protein